MPRPSSHRASDGTLQPQAQGSPNSINAGPLGASSLAISPNSQFIYVATPGGATELAVYRIVNENTGQLNLVQQSNPVVTVPITQLAMSPSGNVLYGLSPAVPSNGHVVAITLDPAGGLPIAQVAQNVGSATPDNGMILSANGKYLYVLDDSQPTQPNYTDLNNITGISPTIYDFTTCLATSECATNPARLVSIGGPFHEDADLAQTPPLFPQGPVAGATSRDSQYLFIANRDTHNISVFDIHTKPDGEPVEFNGGAVTNVGGTPVSTNSPVRCGNGWPPPPVGLGCRYRRHKQPVRRWCK